MTFFRCALVALALAASGAALPAASQRAQPAPIAEVPSAELPREARATLALIRAGGPFPHAKDGSVFGNREGRLPRQKRGYYREYTVKTPGARDRGARRIIAGGAEYFYTDDHYNHFRRIRE